MKISFDDSSYIEMLVRSDKKTVNVTLSAKDGTNSKSRIVSSAEIDRTDFLNLIQYVRSNLDTDVELEQNSNS